LRRRGRAWSDRRIEYPAHVLRLPAVPHERRWQGLLVICVAMFISAVDMTAVNVALPAISDDLGAGVGELQWVVDGFLVALAGLLLVGSGLADRFGRRRVFLGGFTAFAAASVLASLSRTTGELIGARVLMGAGAACVLPPALSLLAVMFPPEERPRALAIWATFAGVGMSMGPVVGGILVRTLGWQWVFLITVPFALVAVPAGRALLPESTREGTPPLDLLGAALSILGLTGIVFALIEGGDVGWTSAPAVGAGVVGLVAMASFVRLEGARRAPLFDVRVVARPVVAAGAAAILATYIAFLGILFLLPQYLQYVHGESVLASAVVLAPIGLATVIAAPYTSTVLAALGARRTIAGGLVVMAAATALLLLLSATTSLLVVIVSTAVLGAAIPITVAPATAVIMDDVGDAKAGDGGAVNQLGRQVGGALGIAIVGSVFAAVYTSRIDDALATLPAPLRGRAGESIEHARDVVASVDPTAQAQLLAEVDHSFDVAARTGFAVAIAALLLGAVAAAIGLRTRPR
jgi:DHA2 family multidrug resistance protein-like MFS transporter